MNRIVALDVFWFYLFQSLNIKKLNLGTLFLPTRYNTFFYTQLTFMFHLQEDFYIVCDHIPAFCFAVLQKDVNTFHELFFEAFICLFFENVTDEFFDIFIYEKKIYMKKINLDTFMNYLKLLKITRNYLKSLGITSNYLKSVEIT